MKLKERPAKPYMTGSELAPPQLASPPAPHELGLPVAVAPGGGDGELPEAGDLELCMQQASGSVTAAGTQHTA